MKLYYLCVRFHSVIGKGKIDPDPVDVSGRFWTMDDVLDYLRNLSRDCVVSFVEITEI